MNVPRVTRQVRHRDELIVWRQLTPDAYTVETYRDGRIVACEVKRGRAPIEFRKPVARAASAG